MVAVAGQERFYVDESAAGLGLALTAARKDVIHVGHQLIPECPRGALDTEWIPAVAHRNLVVIARDKKLRTKPVEIQALWDAGLRVFNIGGKRDQPTWEWLCRIVKFWPRMEQIVVDRAVGPWIYMINETGLQEFRPGDHLHETSDNGAAPKRRRKPTSTGGQTELF